MYFLVTGVAGFIGSALALKLLDEGKSVIGIDNLNDYYDTNLKKNRLARCEQYPSFKFFQLDITDRKSISELFLLYSFEIVIHLAAQAGVRYSVANPYAFIDSNLVGFATILECCRQHQVKHFVYASSSSVYGANVKLPFSEKDAVDHPLSLYGATKRANELMAHSYAHLYQLPCTGLRFFSVYGPWSRPDMALILFARNITEGNIISVFNEGRMTRDFTYIDDIVAGLIQVINHIPQPQITRRTSPETSVAPYRIYNIGNQQPIELIRYIRVLESCLGKKAHLRLLPMQQGDVPNTYADVSDFEKEIGPLPHTSIEEGVTYFVEWFKSYYSSTLVI